MKPIIVKFVTQDGSTFYFDEDDSVTAPRRIWEGYRHDSMRAAEVCRDWFVRSYCPKAGIEPVFN